MKIYYVRKKTAYWALFAILAAIALILFFAFGGGSGKKDNDYESTAAAPANRELPIYSVGTDEKKVSITFDVAYDTDHTAKILDILDKYNIKSTFFVVGFWVDKNPDVVAEIVRRGHELGNHTENHPHMNQLTPEKIKKEISSVNAKLKADYNADVILFRPPYGEYNNTVIKTVKEMGMIPVQWDVDTLDWKGISAAEILKRVKTLLQPGSIILCHNNAPQYAEYLPMIIEYCLDQGYEFVQLSDLLIKGDYYLDHTGRQFPKQ